MEPSKDLRTYIIKPTTNPADNIEIKADDLDLEEIGENDKPFVYHYNFTIDGRTVASFPFNHVMYITSKP